MGESSVLLIELQWLISARQWLISARQWLISPKTAAKSPTLTPYCDIARLHRRQLQETPQLQRHVLDFELTADPYCQPVYSTRGNARGRPHSTPRAIRGHSNPSLDGPHWSRRADRAIDRRPTDGPRTSSCIPVYPYFLLAGLEDRQVQVHESQVPMLALPRYARQINDAMAEYAVQRLQNAIGSLADQSVLILGVAYRGDVREVAFTSAKLLQKALLDMVQRSM